MSNSVTEAELERVSFAADTMLNQHYNEPADIMASPERLGFVTPRCCVCKCISSVSAGHLI